jgi:hypothetical protein
MEKSIELMLEILRETGPAFANPGRAGTLKTPAFQGLSGGIRPLCHLPKAPSERQIVHLPARFLLGRERAGTRGC